MSTIEVNKAHGITSFVGEAATHVFAMRVLANALRGYAKHRIQMNRAYTPSRMLKMAEKWTGQRFKRGQYLEAATAVALAADDLMREKVTVVRHG